MRIAITGSAGFIGSHLFERLALKNIDVAGFVKAKRDSSAASIRRIARLEKIVACQPRAHLFHCPDFGRLNECFAEFKPTACVHLAGLSSVRESLQNPGLYAAANGAAAIEVLEAARRSQCHRMVHASTVMVYGKDAPLPYSEARMGGAPASFYGASKLAAETLMNSWRALHGVEAINLRLFSVYGPDLRSDCVPHLIASSILKGSEFNIFGDGSTVRDYIEIADVLDAIEAAIQTPWGTDFPVALNVGSGVGTTLLDMVCNIEQGLNKKARIVLKPAVSGELHAVVADVSAARQILNWKPGVGLHRGIGQLTDWFKSQVPFIGWVAN